nr:hypothetical protein [Tanacetum cinerariifolium]
EAARVAMGVAVIEAAAAAVSAGVAAAAAMWGDSGGGGSEVHRRRVRESDMDDWIDRSVGNNFRFAGMSPPEKFFGGGRR